MATDWQTEIVELHEFFEGYFLGILAVDSLGRADAAFHPDFTMIGPDGELQGRASIMQMLRDGHGHTDTLRITTSAHNLISADAHVITAMYIERHDLRDGRANERRTTVVFIADDAAPNGVAWRHAHETWIGRDA